MREEERSLRSALRREAPLFGAFKQLGDPVAAEATATLGFDWVGIDRQHGLMGHETMVAMLQGIATAGVPAVVRVSGNRPAEIGKALDAGAEGIIVPLVETAQDAARAVAACRYAPGGTRSWGAVRPSLHVPSYDAAAGDARAACIVLLETVRAVENVEEIAAVPGLDAVYVGPNDLALSAGLAPRTTFEDARHRGYVEAILTACRERGLPAGAHVRRPEDVQEYLDLGFRLLAVHVDLPELLRGGRAALAAARAAAAPR